MVEIATSVLGVKEEEAVKTFYNLEAGHTDYFHIDVMDGKFVETDTRVRMLKYAEIIKQISTIPLDVHFMVEDVQKEILSFLALEPRIITFHWEAVKDKQKAMEIIKQIKDNHCKVGISIKPDTQLEEIYEYLPYIHLVLIMTVEPGKGGQALIPETIQKIKKLDKYRKENKLEIEIEADGGINYATAPEVKEAGIDILVAGSAIIVAKDYKSVIEGLKEMN